MVRTVFCPSQVDCNIRVLDYNASLAALRSFWPKRMQSKNLSQKIHNTVKLYRNETLTVDIGSTWARIARWSGDETILNFNRQESKPFLGPRILDLFERANLEKLERPESLEGIEKIRISITGKVDEASGRYSGWLSECNRGVPTDLAKRMEDRYQLPCSIRNDSVAWGIGWMRVLSHHGKALGGRHLFCILGTAVGLAFWDGSNTHSIEVDEFEAHTFDKLAERADRPQDRGKPWLAVHDHLGKRYFDWRFKNPDHKKSQAFIRDEFTARLVCFVQCIVNSGDYNCHSIVIGGGGSLKSVNEIELKKKCEAFGNVSIMDSALAPEWKGTPCLDFVPHFGLLV